MYVIKDLRRGREDNIRGEQMIMSASSVKGTLKAVKQCSLDRSLAHD